MYIEISMNRGLEISKQVNLNTRGKLNMSQELLHDNSIRVTEFNLIDFTFTVADLGAKGFVPTLLNGSHPEGGFGSYYTCVMVKRDAYRIDEQGNHLNVPKTEETQPEVEVKLHTEEHKQDVGSLQTTQNEKGQPKTRTQAKKTT